ncbi:MAG: hypothetical protein US11_C0004G0011 [Candidatus Roizmanbacteria bacterium GW2011_GWA2_36_23]|uniref:HD domain-containing protein n=1 Tax=Candidatus Roizmanbacteria bacterium GW2011_GWA2_36_23 TaxID=1618480 RepID=A0A0G0HCV9_9BACT|nr:MAG: hypothetical protein US11_C0004G0011 [Candidatus Roizmanbacteria bacterium GW2011_GWA2_36_23]
MNSEFKGIFASLKKSAFVQLLKLSLPFYAKGRLWDSIHLLIGIEHLMTVLKNIKSIKLRNILVPAFILHDIGWSKLGNEKNTGWGSVKMRSLHMKFGAIIAKLLLSEIKYPKKYIPEIINLVAHHDDVYLGKSPKTLEEKLLRDIDSCFIFTAPSFWKDWHIRCHEGLGSDPDEKGLKPLEFLNKQSKKYSLKFTGAAQKITDKEIKSRKLEIKQDILPEKRYLEFKKEADDLNRKINILFNQ